MIIKKFQINKQTFPKLPGNVHLLLSQSGNDDDMLVIRRYQHIYNKYKNDGIIDLDKRLKHKFDFQIYRLGDAVLEVNGEVPPTRQTPYWIVLVKKGIGEKS